MRARMESNERFCYIYTTMAEIDTFSLDLMRDIIEAISAVGWPSATTIVVIAFLLIFRPQIGNLIARTRSVTREGINADLPPEAQNANINSPLRSVAKEGINADLPPETHNEENRKLAVEELMNLGRSITRDETENIIFADLEKQSLDAKGDTVRILVRHLAATQMALDFFQIYHSIFGGQIFILKRLHQVAGVGLVEQDVDSIFVGRKAIVRGVLDEWDLQRYLLYLYDNLLITKSDDRLHITNKGQDFLVWLAQRGLPENKGL